jgi:hypothetical protein
MICSSVNLLFRIRPPRSVEDWHSDPSSFQGAGQWYSRFHTYLGTFEPEKWIRREVESFPDKERAEQKYEFKRLSSRVVPLSSVRDSEALRKFVVQPLLDDLAAGRADKNGAA